MLEGVCGEGERGDAQWLVLGRVRRVRMPHHHDVVALQPEPPQTLQQENGVQNGLFVKILFYSLKNNFVLKNELISLK